MKITVVYNAKWQVIDAVWYKFTDCKKLINTKTGREVKKTLKGACAGFYIDRKFVKLTDLKTKIELISKNEVLPF